MTKIMKIFDAFLLIGCCLGECSRMVMRREIRELSDREVRDFVTALNKLHQEKNGALSAYEEFSKVHMENKETTHFTPQFLPWHRHFIRRLEVELQRINPRVVLPYWDWTLDSQQPHASPVLTRKYLGGNGDAGRDYCIKEGPFSKWKMSYPTPHCLRRNYDSGTKISPFTSPEAMSVDLNEPKFSSFSLQLEIKHGSPHVNIGGEKGDLYPMYSPNDPIFFLHHAFVDLLWAEWQARHPDAIYEGARYRKEATVDDVMTPYSNYSVKSTLDTSSDFYCYSYPRYPRPIVTRRTPPRLRMLMDGLVQSNPFLGPAMTRITRDNAKKEFPTILGATKELLADFGSFRIKHSPLLKRKPLPAAFIRMNRLDPREVAESEREESSFVDILNSAPGFTSLSQAQAVIDAHERRTFLSNVLFEGF